MFANSKVYAFQPTAFAFRQITRVFLSALVWLWMAINMIGQMLFDKVPAQILSAV